MFASLVKFIPRSHNHHIVPVPQLQVPEVLVAPVFAEIEAESDVFLLPCYGVVPRIAVQVEEAAPDD